MASSSKRFYKDSAPPRKEKTSVLLSNVLKDLPEPVVSIGDVVVQLRSRSFGGILIALAAIGLLPGISIFSGIVMAVIGLQMFAGYRAPFLPKFVRNKEVESRLVRVIGEKCIILVTGIEKFVKPRWLLLTIPPVTNILGLVVFALGLVIMSPLPFSNLPPAIALLIISAGLLERDGLMIAFGIGVAAIALSIGLFMAYFAIESLILFIGNS
jgi:hypothetical protein